MKNATRKVILRKSKQEIEVYKLRQGTPTDKHVYCNAVDCSTTYTERQLKFLDADARKEALNKSREEGGRFFVTMDKGVYKVTTEKFPSSVFCFKDGNEIAV